MIQEGDQFPDFSLPDQDGSVMSLDDLKGAPAVVYFYPKDDTSGCTTQACGFREALPSYGDVRVVGISPDPPKSHRKFVDKYDLNFTLLSDVEHTLLEEVGVWVKKSMYGREYMGVERTTFLLDANGSVKKIWRKVKPASHAEEVAGALNA